MIENGKQCLLVYLNLICWVFLFFLLSIFATLFFSGVLGQKKISKTQEYPFPNYFAGAVYL